LLAEDDDAVRDMLQKTLERDGFEVVAVANVCDALRYIATESFDALLSDLHMPHAGDGFTVVSAMRHTHPQAVTLVLSGYPAIDEALSAIRLQADEVLMKPNSNRRASGSYPQEACRPGSSSAVAYRERRLHTGAWHECHNSGLDGAGGEPGRVDLYPAER
jgi:DNA-binding NtrC family response regulator